MVTTLTSHYPGLSPRARAHFLVRKVSFWCRAFSSAGPFVPWLPAPCQQHVPILPPSSPTVGLLASAPTSEGGVNLPATERSRIFTCMMQKLKPGDSPNSSHRLTHPLNGRGITETGERKTNLQRRNFALMTPLIIRFLIRKSSLMRRNRTLHFHENYSCPGD